jgi:hypothetical protein
MNNSNNSKRMASLISVAVTRIITNAARTPGRLIADINELGVLLAAGEHNPQDTSRRWYVVLATNDVANHLEQFVEEQAKMRQAADALNPNIETIVHEGNGDLDAALTEMLEGLGKDPLDR